MARPDKITRGAAINTVRQWISDTQPMSQQGVPPTNSWSSFPGYNTRGQYDSGYGSAPYGSRPIPQQPSHMSDFVHDFYSVGGGDGGLLGGPSAQYQDVQTPGASSSSGSRFAPPPGAPPTKSAPTSPMNSNDPSQDDGRPTETPVPGRPLLRHGKVLVYPSGYECPKCKCVLMSDASSRV